MNRAEIEQSVMDMISQELGYDDCESNMDFMDDIGCASVDLMELYAWAEKKYGFKITPADMRSLMTPDDLIDLIEKEIKKKVDSGE